MNVTQIVFGFLPVYLQLLYTIFHDNIVVDIDINEIFLQITQKL
jgi:hypothetical protein